MTSSTKPLYAGHRFPPELISDTVWLYYRFPLSHRMVEERLAFRGIAVSHETIRQWGLKFGRAFANLIRRRLPRPGDKWHLDEVVLKIAGKTHYLWRAVDQHGAVLDVLVQSRRDRKAAKRRLRKLLKRQCRAPRVMITDRLKSYGAAKREIRPGVEHRQHNGLNNRAENSHQPTRRPNGRGSGSSRPDRPSASCPPATRSTTSSACPASRASCACAVSVRRSFASLRATACLQPTTAPSEPAPSRRGTTSAASSKRHRPHRPWRRHARPDLGSRSTT